MKVAIVSLRFAPGHIAHLKAYRELFSSLDCETQMFLDKGYRAFVSETRDIKFVDSIQSILSWKPDMVFSYNISNVNIRLSRQCKKNSIPFYYVLHEPWDSFRELISLRKRMPRRVVANIVNYLTSHYAYKVILASENGLKKYKRYMKGCNRNCAVFPLIFCDDFNEEKQVKRKFFSFIGGFTYMRGCNEFLSFIKYSITHNLDIQFCIATRSSVDAILDAPLYKKAIENGTLHVFAGKPMTSNEINLHYRESICAWNAYKSSTQSGVLVNALMQGTPVIVTDRGDTSDVVRDKKESCFINIPYDNEEIYKAYNYIADNIVEMEQKARGTFLNHFLYITYLNDAKKIYEI